MNSHNFSLQIGSSPDNINLIEPFIQKCRDNWNFNDQLYFDMLLVLTEAVNNSMQHGNRFDPQKKVFIECRKNGNSIHFTIRDEGSGFQLANVPDPTHKDHICQPNGRGVFLIQQMSDQVAYKDEGRAVEIQFRYE